jgi:hypothetical protein
MLRIVAFVVIAVVAVVALPGLHWMGRWILRRRFADPAIDTLIKPVTYRFTTHDERLSVAADDRRRRAELAARDARKIRTEQAEPKLIRLVG